MKKLVAGILAAAFVLSVSATSVFAMGGRGLGFVDEDGGVCDYYGTGRCARYADTSNS